jgi:hypothetical protein
MTRDPTRCHVTLHPATRGPWSHCGLPVVKFGLCAAHYRARVR